MEAIATQQTDFKSNSTSRAEPPRASGELARPQPVPGADVPPGPGTLPDIEQAVAVSWDAKGNLVLRRQSWHDDDRSVVWAGGAPPS